MWILCLLMKKRQRRSLVEEPEEALEMIGKQCSIAIVKIGCRGFFDP